MRLLILTTPTLHHLFYVKEMVAADNNATVFLETSPLQAPFPAATGFEIERDRHESEFWFAGHPPSFADLAPTQEFATLDTTEVLAAAQEARPELVLTFGTRRLRPELIAAFPDRLLNLHGGDPEEYRGLDTHLWAIYHNDFGALVTTLHRLTPRLDAGEIVVQAPLHLISAEGLHHLRRINTELCVQLSLTALDMVMRFGNVLSRPQRRKGRYYSFMPGVLKEICDTKFRRHLGSIQ